MLFWVFSPLTSRVAFRDIELLALEERSGLRPPKASDVKCFLAFVLAQQRAFIPKGPGTAIFLPSAGAGGAGGPGGGRKALPRPRCSSAAPCGAFCLAVLTLFSRRDARAGPRLPGDRPG